MKAITNNIFQELPTFWRSVKHGVHFLHYTKKRSRHQGNTQLHEYHTSLDCERLRRKILQAYSHFRGGCSHLYRHQSCYLHCRNLGHGSFEKECRVFFKVSKIMDAITSPVLLCLPWLSTKSRNRSCTSYWPSILQ